MTLSRGFGRVRTRGATLYAATLVLSVAAVGCSDVGSSPTTTQHLIEAAPDSVRDAPITSAGPPEWASDLPTPVPQDPCRDEFQAAVAPVLPSPVQQTRDRLVEAAAQGQWLVLDSLSAQVGNRFRFSFGDPDLTPVAYWLQYEGAAFLNDLAFVLAAEPAFVGDSYVWPRWAAEEWDHLGPEALAAINCAAGADAARTMREDARYTWVRTAIESDGTWSYYVSGD